MILVLFKHRQFFFVCNKVVVQQLGNCYVSSVKIVIVIKNQHHCTRDEYISDQSLSTDAKG